MKVNIFVSELHTILKTVEVKNYDEAHEIAEEIAEDFPAYAPDFVDSRIEVYKVNEADE